MRLLQATQEGRDKEELFRIVEQVAARGQEALEQLVQDFPNHHSIDQFKIKLSRLIWLNLLNF